MTKRSTTGLLKFLRVLMNDKQYVSQQVHAYIVPSIDAHNSEYLADCDKFRDFISGFTGSMGTAVITSEEACLWTDGRYFLQASQQLDDNWTLMKVNLPETPTIGEWLCKILPPKSRVGVDPQLYSQRSWFSLQNQLSKEGHELVPIIKNLVSALWPDRPERPANPVLPLEVKFTGSKINEKLEIIRQEMTKRKAGMLVLTSLDDIAWLLNLRGSDIIYNPVFFSYTVVLPSSIVLFINSKQVTDEMREHLTEQAKAFEILPYDDIKKYLESNVSKVVGRIWFAESSSYALTSLVPSDKLLLQISPVTLMKAVKNNVEIKGMRNAHIKDAVALCSYFAWLEKNINNNVTEISGAKKLEEFRQQQEDYVGLSFGTISSVGAHGAIIHYQPQECTDVPITTDKLYLCDSGAQYKDGTTDVTRTFHFGTPTDHQKTCFTMVLKGQIKLATIIFPKKIVGNTLDSFARQFLWSLGLDYAHGTSHGVGSYLNVHEGPMAISWSRYEDDPGLEPGMFLSNEPGYYEDGEFGMRIEDIVQIVEAKTLFNFDNRSYCTFDTITLVPKQTKLIKKELLTNEEIEYLNNYHLQCRNIIGPLLENAGNLEAKKWLWKETEPI